MPKKFPMTRLADRYVCLKFLRFYFLAALALVASALVLEVVGLAARLAAGQPLSLVVRIFLHHVPALYSTLSPLAALLAAVACLALMDRNRETMVLEGSGVNPFRIWQPLMAGAAAIALLPFLVSETVIPRLSDPEADSREISTPVLALPRMFLFAERYSPVTGRFSNINIIMLRPEGTLGEIYQAESAEAAPSENWLLQRGARVHFTGAGTISGREDFDRLAVDTGLPADKFVPLLKPIETLNAAQLRGYLGMLAEAGLAPPRVRTTYFSRFSYPALNPLVALFALPLLLLRRFPRPVMIAACLLPGAALYWAYSLFLALGRQGALPAAASAFMTHLLLFPAAAVLIIRKSSAGGPRRERILRTGPETGGPRDQTTGERQ